MKQNKFITAFEKITKSIAEALQDDSATQTDQAKVTEAKLDNGTIVQIKGEISNGNIVFTLSDGIETPYPNGEYHLVDKSLLRVENGIITEYVPFVEPKADDKSKNQDECQTTGVHQKADEPSNNDKQNSEAEQTKSLIDVLQKQIKELNDKYEVQSKVNIELNKQIQLLSDQPSEKPLIPTDDMQKCVDYSKMSFAQRLAYKAKNKK